MNYRELQERWRTFERDANIYRVDQEIRSRDDLGGIAKRAGIEIPPDEWEDLGFVLHCDSHPLMFTVYALSRGLRYVDTSVWQVDDGVSSLEVSDEEAFRQADREADRLQLFGADSFRPRRVRRLNVAAARVGGEASETRVIDVAAVYTRVIDDILVEGPGGSVVVYLGRDMALTGFERVARPLAGIYAPVKAWRDLDDGLSEVEQHWKARYEQDFSVEDARLRYLELGRLQRQELMEPVYVLSLRFKNHENGEARRVEHFVSAATNGTGRLMPQGEERFQQPER